MLGKQKGTLASSKTTLSRMEIKKEESIILKTKTNSNKKWCSKDEELQEQDECPNLR